MTDAGGCYFTPLWEGITGFTFHSSLFTLHSFPDLNIYLPPLFFVLVVSVSGGMGDWPQFRGPLGDGVAPLAEPPLKWSETQGMKWKSPVHDEGWSSPIVFGGQVWLTTASKDGRELFAMAFDRVSGKVVHDLKVFTVEQPQSHFGHNTYASPTPAAEPGRIYVHFGYAGTACLDTGSGKKLWERRDLVCNHFRGAGSSPVIFRHLLLLQADCIDEQYVMALDTDTGRTVWKTSRSIDFRDLDERGKPATGGDFRKAFGTAQVAELGGQSVMLSSGAKALYGYDPLSGKELWRVEERTSHSTGTRPVTGQGIVFAPTGWSNGQILAVVPGAPGEVLDANDTAAPTGKLHLAWKTKRFVPRKASLTYFNDLLFGITDDGVATCWDAVSGDVRWNERIGGNNSASPALAAGRLYFFNEEGKGTVVAARGQFEKLAENQLAEGCMASPAAAGKSLFVRTKSNLYCLMAGE